MCSTFDGMRCIFAGSMDDISEEMLANLDVGDYDVMDDEFVLDRLK